jgi:hypothetical protein
MNFSDFPANVLSLAFLLTLSRYGHMFIIMTSLNTAPSDGPSVLCREIIKKECERQDRDVPIYYSANAAPKEEEETS